LFVKKRPHIDLLSTILRMKRLGVGK